MNHANNRITESDMLITVLDEQKDVDLIALAVDRMRKYDPSQLVTQAQVDAEFGFTENE